MSLSSVRTKIYGRAGKYDIDNKWKQGVCIDPSEDVALGHVVKFPGGTFVTSLHLKANLVDADSMADLEPPTTRTTAEGEDEAGCNDGESPAVC